MGNPVIHAQMGNPVTDALMGNPNLLPEGQACHECPPPPQSLLFILIHCVAHQKCHIQILFIARFLKSLIVKLKNNENN